ncbi:hypothetical protein CIRG_05385 [Coccidioides immitis RMSCC 2394]|uniref:Uncharacterized protein n=1 Tax=Coccidioides immitis RMSCC 2394 TaxID=404692 RepID=A0A0J6YF95_COCIT|nr:hypothetical protein CIRG_05385 [Coccidioides immitis RMSCC 2394]
MKAHYRSAIAELSYLDNAAPVKKKCFIKAYSQACIKALEPWLLFISLAVKQKPFGIRKSGNRVQLDPDSQFANIGKIGQAMEEAAALQARLQQCQPETEPEKTEVAAALEAGLQARIIEWYAY